MFTFAVHAVFKTLSSAFGRMRRALRNTADVFAEAQDMARAAHERSPFVDF